jgi:hypothetical protein
MYIGLGWNIILYTSIQLPQFVQITHFIYLRNKSWKPECVVSFNMDWRILVFYPEPEARDKIY